MWIYDSSVLTMFDLHCSDIYHCVRITMITISATVAYWLTHLGTQNTLD